MNNIWKFAILILIITSCANEKKIDTKTYFLSYIDDLFEAETLFSDSLSPEQNKIIEKYNLGVHIPKHFKSIEDDNDKDAFIFFNSNDSSLLLARCFDFNDTINNQIESSIKFDSPIYGPNYNDLSEFEHFKLCEKIITDSLIGPFYFGGTLFQFLCAQTVMHQEFIPKNKKYKFGEFIILIDNEKYMFTYHLHNGYSDNLNDRPRWNAFRFVEDKVKESQIDDINGVLIIEKNEETIDIKLYENNNINGSLHFSVFVNGWYKNDTITIYAVGPNEEQVLLLKEGDKLHASDKGALEFSVPYNHNNLYPGEWVLILKGRSGTHGHIFNVPTQ